MTLSPEAARLAERLASLQGIPVDQVIDRAIKESARAAGVVAEPPRRRMTVEQMLRLGEEIAALPLLDRRPSREIMDELSAK